MNLDEANSKVMENLILMKMVYKKGEKLKVVKKEEIQFNSKQNFILGTLYKNLEKFERAFELYLKSGDQGYTKGYIECGKLLEKYKIPVKDHSPKYFYEKSIELGDSNGYLRMGLLEKKLDYIKKASDMNDPEAYFELSKFENKYENLKRSKELKFEKAIIYSAIDDILDGYIRFGINELKLFSKNFVNKLDKFLKLIEMFLSKEIKKNQKKQDKKEDNSSEGDEEDNQSDDSKETSTTDEENENKEENSKEEKKENNSEETESEEESDSENEDNTDETDSEEESEIEEISEDESSESEEEEIEFEEDIKLNNILISKYNLEESFLFTFKEYDLHDNHDKFKDFIFDLSIGEIYYILSLIKEDHLKIDYLKKSIFENSNHRFTNLAKLDANFEMIKQQKNNLYEIKQVNDTEKFYFDMINFLDNKEELKNLILKEYPKIDLRNKDLLIYISYSEYILYKIEIQDKQLSDAILKNSMNHGNIHSGFIYGCNLLKKKNYKEAYKILLNCVDTNHSGAHLVLSLLFKDQNFIYNQNPIEIYFFINFFKEIITKENKEIIIDLFIHLEEDQLRNYLLITFIILLGNVKVLEELKFENKHFKEWIQKEKSEKIYTFYDGFRDFILGYILNDSSYFEKSGLIAYHPLSRKMIGFSYDCHLPIGYHQLYQLNMNLLDPKVSFIKNNVNFLNLDEKFYEHLLNIKEEPLKFHSFDVIKQPFQIKYEYYLYQLNIDKNLKSKL